MKDRKLLRIIGQATKGDEEAFNLLMQAKSRDILYIAMSIMRDKQASEDVAQDVAIAMQSNITNLCNPQSFNAWMYRIVYNACMDEKKKMSKEKHNSEVDAEVENSIVERHDAFLPEEFVTNQEKKRELIAAIHELPEKQRLCIVLYYYEELSYEEIAEVIGADTQKVTYLLWAGKKNLREKVLPEGTDIGIQGKNAGFLAAVPVLSHALEFDAQSSITAPMVERFLAVAVLGQTASAVAAGTAGVTATAAGGGVASIVHDKFSTFSIGKTIITGACVLTIVGGTIAFVNSGTHDMNEEQATAPRDQDNPALLEESKNTDPDTLDSEEVPADVDLSDQGNDTNIDSDFGQIPGITQPDNSEETGNTSEEQAKRYFVERISKLEGGNVYEYSLYFLDNPGSTNLLVTIERKDENGTVVTAKNTLPRESALPSNFEIVDAFDAWKKE